MGLASHSGGSKNLATVGVGLHCVSKLMVSSCIVLLITLYILSYYFNIAIADLLLLPLIVNQWTNINMTCCLRIGQFLF